MIKGKRKENTSTKVPKKVTEGMSKLKAWQLWLAKREQEVLKIKDVDTGLEVRDYDAYQHRLDSREAKKDPKQVKQDKADSDAFEKIAEKFVPKGSNKAWESWLEEEKSNTERSIHGNAGREPNSGVNTNTGFDAPKDYEGFSHSGVRPEQFKHERKKPKVTNKERINIGSTAPTSGKQGTGDGGNPYNTRTQNKDTKGRAESGKDRN